jgi:hypothetical protein
VKHRTIANLSHCKAEEVEAIRLALRHKADLARIVSAAGEGGLELVQGPSVGAVWLLSQLARDLGTVAALGSDRRAKVGDPLLHETEVGPLILPREADRVSAWTDEAVLAGAKVIGGGRLNSATARRWRRRSSSTRLPTPRSRPTRCSGRLPVCIHSRGSTKLSRPRIRCRWRFRPASSPKISGPRSTWPSASQRRPQWSTTIRHSAPIGCPSLDAARPAMASAGFPGRCAK